MSTQDPVIEEAMLVIDIYDYALTHTLNIESKNDVKTILKALNQKDVSDARIKKIVAALQVIDHKIKADVARRGKIN